MLSLFKSRKFILALLGVIQTAVSFYFDIPPEVWASIDALIMSVIFGIAYEDGKAKEHTNYSEVMSTMRHTGSR